MQFVGLTQIASTVLAAADGQVESLDRVDRVRLFESLPDTDPGSLDSLQPVFGPNLQDRATEIEELRAAIGSLTAFTERRLQALRDCIDECPQPARRDAHRQVDAAISAHSAVADATDETTSPGTDAVLEEAVALIQDDPSVWEEAYPAIERVHIAGVGSLRAPLFDLLKTIADHTAAEMHLYLRAGTGPQIAGFIDGRPADTVARQPITTTTPSTPTEVVTTTREQEARAAMAITDQLLSAGVSPSDIVMTTRTATTYETALKRAARQYGRKVSIWTQLELKQTTPYRLLTTLCDLLSVVHDDVSGTSTTTSSTPVSVPYDLLEQAIAAEWIPPSGYQSASGSYTWEPLPNPRIQIPDDTAESWPGEALTLDEWELVLNATPDAGSATARLQSLLTWLDDQPAEPTPRDIREALIPVFEAYCDVVLQTYPERDDAALTATLEAARAADRVVDMAGHDHGDGLIAQVARKYADWLSRGQLTQSWSNVTYLAETIASVTPGRREHAHGGVVDVLDATNAWLRDVPFVIALGCVDGEWPQTAGGILPAEVRARIQANETVAAKCLPSREQWSTARDYDHWADAVGMASQHLICTRYERVSDGTTAHRSPLLDTLETASVRGQEVTALLSTSQVFPDLLESALSAAPQFSSPVDTQPGPAQEQEHAHSQQPSNTSEVDTQ
jgi:ATP-dependent helicase/nuclease subunit B